MDGTSDQEIISASPNIQKRSRQPPNEISEEISSIAKRPRGRPRKTTFGDVSPPIPKRTGPPTQPVSRSSSGVTNTYPELLKRGRPRKIIGARIPFMDITNSPTASTSNGIESQKSTVTTQNSTTSSQPRNATDHRNSQTLGVSSRCKEKQTVDAVINSQPVTTDRRNHIVIDDLTQGYQSRYANESESDDEDAELENDTDVIIGESSGANQHSDDAFCSIGPSVKNFFEEKTDDGKVYLHYTCYQDDGDPIYGCTFCQAFMWYGERIGKPRKQSIPTFTICCKKGKIVLPRLKNPPIELIELLCKGDALSKHFREFIRAYNMLFSFTYLGGRIDHSVNNGGGPYVYKMNGENYHMIGNIIPRDGEIPKFSQLYIFDTMNEIKNRIKAYGSGGADGGKLKESVVLILKTMLDSVNTHVKAFRQVRDRFDADGVDKFKIRLIEGRGSDGRTHNLPTADEVAALIPGDFSLNMEKRDIILETNDGAFKRISELHPAYLPLQYPLLFPYGEDGYRIDIPIGLANTTGRKRKMITMREFFAFRIVERSFEAPTITRSGRLFQQFLVDAYTMIESSRLRFVWFNQKKLRCNNYETIQKTAAAGGENMSKQGSRIFIPASFTGGPRYMQQHYLDAMAICRYLGFPDIFITFTCNPKWPEITRYLNKYGLTTEDRPDIICRIFKIKLDDLMAELTKKKGGVFGKTAAAMYTIEFQKRGLPHAHILLFLEKVNKISMTDDIDRFISAEIPDSVSDPQLYNVVRDSMLHGPCGRANPRQVCMVNGKCSKSFPKAFASSTTVDANGFPSYKRNNDGRTVEKNGFQLDNRFVVPYNKDLLIRYRAHMNVEWCVQTRAVKYLFKYIHKGPDYVSAAIDVEENGVIDKIKRYLDCRYISACEATWRILAFATNFRTLPVEKLSFHLPGQEVHVHDEDEPLESLLSRTTVSMSMFVAWFDACRTYPEARTLTYAEMPTKFTWVKKERAWKPRKRGKAIGRIAHVTPSQDELYYLRILLNYVKGPLSYDDIKTVNGVTYDRFVDACESLGLLDDDKEYVRAIKDASEFSTGSYLLKLFCRMLNGDCLTKPEIVWEQCWEYITEDILFNHRKEHNDFGLNLSVEQIKNIALTRIEQYLKCRGKTLDKWTQMPKPDNFMEYNGNRLIDEERNYNQEDQRREQARLLGMITDEQRRVYDEIMNSVVENKGGVFFLYGFGGTGKTFIWNTLSAAVRGMGKIVINTASSGIAALLLPGGRTAHSRFAIPINPDESTSCKIDPGTDLAGLMVQADLIIWDEAPMMSRHCFENLDRALRDIVRSNDDKPFGGKVVVFGGDFRQILPVIPGSGRTETVLASLNSSYIWNSCKVLKLTKNMRLLGGLSIEDAAELKEFSDWILAIGDGEINNPNTGVVEIDIPEDLLIKECGDPIHTIVKEVYGDSFDGSCNADFFKTRAILSPTNDDVDQINAYMLSNLPGEEQVILSSDSISPTDRDPKNVVDYPMEFLNSIKVSGLPKHELKIKKGAPVMCLRNIDPTDGLCNGTRLIVTQSTPHVIEAVIITGSEKHIGEKVLIPRMFVTPPDGRFPFRMRRRQFPITLAFAITIKKSQGQALENVGLFLPRQVFSHGQLYVALSRVKSRRGLKILITDEKGNVQKKTTNVVYKEVFQKI